MKYAAIASGLCAASQVFAAPLDNKSITLPRPDCLSNVCEAGGGSKELRLMPSAEHINTVNGETIEGGHSIYDGNWIVTESTINGSIQIYDPMDGVPENDDIKVWLRGSAVLGSIKIDEHTLLFVDHSKVTDDWLGYGAIEVNGGDIAISNSQVSGMASGIWITPSEGVESDVIVNASDIAVVDGPAIMVSGAEGTSNIAVLNGATLSGGDGNILLVQGGATGTVNFAATNVDLYGNITVRGTQSTVNVAMANHGNITGAMTNVDTLDIRSSKWTLTGDSKIGAITGVDAFIDTQASTLNTGSLAGTGTITSDVTRVGQRATVNVSGDMSGTWQVGVTDTQHNYAEGALQTAYVVVDVGGTNTAAVSGKSDIGAYQYTSMVDANGDVVAVQTGVPPAPTVPAKPVQPVLNDGALAAVNAMSVASSKAIWDSQFSALHLRQQALRDDAPGKGSFWAQTYGGEYNLGNGYSTAGQDTFDARVYGLSIGADVVLHRDDASQAYGGAYASYVEEDRNASTSSGKAHGYSVGLYGAWQHNSGWYVEGMAAFGNFDNRFSALYYGDPTRSTVNANDWSSRSTALYAEVGKQFEVADGWAVQPAVGIRYLHQNSQAFTTDVGHFVTADGVGSAGANASVTLSKQFVQGSSTFTPYVRVGYANEFAGTQTVHYAGASIDTQLDTSRAFINTGVSAVIAKRHALFADFQYQKGRDVENTYLVNAGYRYAF